VEDDSTNSTRRPGTKDSAPDKRDGAVLGAASDEDHQPRKKSRNKKDERITRANEWRDMFKPIEGGYECEWIECGEKDHKGREHNSVLTSTDISTMRKHLKRYHTIIWKAAEHALKNNKKIPIADLRRDWLKSTANHKTHRQTVIQANYIKKRKASGKHNDQDLALAAFIAENGISLRAFDSRSWLNFCNISGVKTPSAGVLSTTTIPTMALAIQQSRDHHLRKATAVAFAIDGWDAGAQGHVLGAVAHAILPDWTLVRNIFSLSQITANATAPLLVALLRAKLSARLPNAQICAVVTDGGANFRAASSTLVDEPFTCVCHSLQLVVKEIVKGMFT